MIGTFAGIIFSVSERQVLNFQDLQRESAARFANHEVIGRKPKKEFLGPALDTMSWSIELNATQGVRPSSMLKRLDNVVETGFSSYFILGGRNLGLYVITSKSEAYEIILQGGQVVKAKVDISLEEYR